MSNKLKVIPLGGLGAIGRNMNVVEYNGKILIIDCGVLFPREGEPGVDLILPDFSYLEDKLDKIEAIVLTHGHEDHIGGVPYLLKLRQDIPIISSPFTLALVSNKLKEHRIKSIMIEVRPHDIHKTKSFELEFVQVNHSIPDALAVYVSTPAGTLIDTGDIKLDQTPLDKKITDLGHFAWLSQKGVDLLMIDSTNAEYPGVIPTESAIEKELDFIFYQSKSKIVVTSFASHIHRIQQIVNCAMKYNRKISFVGRSMAKNIPLAKEYGLIHYPDEIVVDPRDIEKFPDNRIVLVCTGSQGEPMAALSRVANGDHNFVEVNEGDTVILASSLIPGNEKSIYKVINQLAERKVKVYHSKNSKIHVSGHAAKTDLQILYNVIRPKNAMPIHGESMHLAANAQIAKSVGIPSNRVIEARDGSVIEIENSFAKIVDKIENSYVFIDGKTIGEISQEDLKDRQTLSKEGFISLFMVVDAKDCRVVVKPKLTFRGVAEPKSSFDRILEEITNKVINAMKEGEKDSAKLSKIVRKVLGSFVGFKLKREPILVPVVAVI